MEELNKGYEFTKAQIAELETLRARLAEIEAQEPVAFAYYSNNPDVESLKCEIERLRALQRTSFDLEMDSLARENQLLKTELEAARKDAERYRWICSDDRSSHDVARLTEGDIFYKGKYDIDSAIDAAIEQAKEGCQHEWDSDGDPGPGETMTLRCRYCGEEEQAKGAA